jgi:hypothetical protein
VPMPLVAAFERSTQLTPSTGKDASPRAPHLEPTARQYRSRSARRQEISRRATDS